MSAKTLFWVTVLALNPAVAAYILAERRDRRRRQRPDFRSEAATSLYGQGSANGPTPE